MRGRWVLVLALVLVGVSLAHGAQIYRWVDAEGTVHFTTDVRDIPEALRSEALRSPVASSAGQAPQIEELAVIVPPGPVEVPLRASGSALQVEAVLNGSLTTTFILDTGAGKTLINPETARSLNLDVGPATPALVGRVAGGSVVAFPVVYLDSLALGEAVVEDLGVLVGQGPQLLGMDVLEQFHYRIDPASEVLILKPRSRLQPGELRGGHPRAWWERKFSFLGERIRQEEALLEELESRLKVLPPGPDRVEVIHLRRKVAERLEGWRQRLRALEYRAAEALVPLDWRSLP